MCRVCPARLSCAGACDVRPFRVFFLLAAADAIVAIALWLPRLLGFTVGNVAGAPLAVWHRDEILFGMMPAVLAGFLLTALPRWTRCAPASPALVIGLAGLWLAGRVAHLIPGESFYRLAWPTGIAFLFIVVLTVMAARQVIAGRVWREIKVVLLLASFAAAMGLHLLHLANATGEVAMRLGLASVIALVVVLGGRILPALTKAWLEARGLTAEKVHRTWFETTTALAVACALTSWAVAPTAEITAVASVFACLTQAVRLVLWQGWRVAGSASILALHVAYGWIPVGFALHAAAYLWPSVVSEAAAVHAWGIGAMGLMSIAVMGSMIRRQSRTPFIGSAFLSLSLACAALAAPARIAAEVVTHESRSSWLLASACGWIAAFAFFLIAFRRPLLGRSRS